MTKRAQQAVFLSIFKDKDGKETFQPYRVEQKKDSDKMELAAVPNEPSLDENGKAKVKAMNRAARNILFARKRKHEGW